MKKTSSERQKELLAYVLKNEEVSINDLSQKFNVTMETVRKDVTTLEEKKLVTKKHGFVLSSQPYNEAPIHAKSEIQKEEKIHIAEIALSMIPDNATIILDSSSTTLHLAKLLVGRDDLIIFSNSLPVIDILSPSENKVFMVGGSLRKENQSFNGMWAEMVLDQLSVDMAFVSCNGFSSDGPRIHAYGEVGIKQRMVKNAATTVLLADSSKFSLNGLYCYASFSDIDALITERVLTEEEEKLFPGNLVIYSDVTIGT